MTRGPAGRFARPARIVGLLAKLLGAGAIAQLLSVLTGLALLRWLSIEEFAQYTVAFGLSATLAALVDVEPGLVVAAAPAAVLARRSASRETARATGAEALPDTDHRLKTEVALGNSAQTAVGVA